jgi:MFS family permease
MCVRQFDASLCRTVACTEVRILGAASPDTGGPAVAAPQRAEGRQIGRGNHFPGAMATPARTPTDQDPDFAAYRPRNFWAWVAYQFFYRIGWQFKMEATMVAGLISYLTPDQRTMGLFTMVNTLGRQASPLVAAPHVDRWAHKRGALLLYWGATVACWMALTLFLWLPAARDRDLTLRVFGVCYTLFFICLGASSVAQGALLGKIIPATLRGRAMAVGMGMSGAINVGAILGIYFLVSGGGFSPPRNYALVFSLTVICFVFAAGSLLAVQEWPSPPRRGATDFLASMAHVIRMARGNRNLRLLMLVNVAVSIGTSLLQFYTGFWRHSYPAGRFPEQALIVATIFQVFWQSLSSALLGRVADERGNRIVICALLWVEASVPFVAILIGAIPSLQGTWAFLTLYTLIGIRFPVFQLLVNYLLEILPMEDHALGIGATNTIQMFTAPAPLILGTIAFRFGYAAAFLVSGLVICAGAIVALGLQEPRVEGARASSEHCGKEGLEPKLK